MCKPGCRWGCRREGADGRAAKREAADGGALSTSLSANVSVEKRTEQDEPGHEQKEADRAGKARGGRSEEGVGRKREAWCGIESGVAEGGLTKEGGERRAERGGERGGR